MTSHAARIKAFISDMYDDDEIVNQLTESTPLIEFNIIDSMSIFQMVNFIYNEFKVSIPFERITIDNFKSIADIVNLIDNMRN